MSAQITEIEAHVIVFGSADLSLSSGILCNGAAGWRKQPPGLRSGTLVVKANLCTAVPKSSLQASEHTRTDTIILTLTYPNSFDLAHHLSFTTIKSHRPLADFVYSFVCLFWSSSWGFWGWTEAWLGALRYNYNFPDMDIKSIKSIL